MSGTQTNFPVYTIQVGTVGTFTDDSNIDVAAIVNSEIADAPAGDSLYIIFEPGVYAENSPILLPSNTSVQGEGATLEELASTQTNGNGALIANMDTHMMGGTIYTNHIDGTSTQNARDGTKTAWIDENGTAKIDENISVQGMTFNTTGALNYTSTHLYHDPTFGTWFENAVNVDVQDNVYLGGVDGNAFVDVSNAVASDNIAIGQENAAYDNWNGPTNITIENDQSYMLGDPTSGWSVLFNSTPTGNPSNTGNASNDAVVGSLFSSHWVGSSSGNSDPLESYGFTTESHMTQQGNVISSLNIPDTGAFYSANVVSQNLIEDDVFTSQNIATSSYAIIGAYSSSATLSSSSQIIGNLIFGTWTEQSSPLIVNQGLNVSTLNNADIDENTYQGNAISTMGVGGTASVSGNILNGGTTVTGSGTNPVIDISAEPNLFCSALTATNVAVSVNDLVENDTLSLTITSSFGTLSLSQEEGIVSSETFGTYGSQQGLVITGNLNQVNTDLQGLMFTSDSQGWDDAIELNLSGTSGLSATRYIPITVANAGSETNGGVIILPGSFLGTLAQESTLFPGQTLLAEPSMDGEIAISAAGNNTVKMGASISAVFLGEGSNTVWGDSKQGYISTQNGDAFINLSLGGDITVAGGAGSMTVDAATGNDMIEVGSSTASITAGSGSITVVGGLGDATVTGGTGPLYIATLPQDGGRMDIDLGFGASTVFALSGQNILRTNPGSCNLIYTGLGADSVISQGNDIINTGAGSTTVYGSGGSGTDYVTGGTGSLTYIVGTENAVIIPAANTQIIDQGPGSIAIGAGPYALDVKASTSQDGFLELQVLGSVTLHSAILHEALADNTLTIGLNDGTTIQILDPTGVEATTTSTGLLKLSGTTLSAGVPLLFASGLTGVSSDGSTNDAPALSAAEGNLPGQTELLFSSGTFDLNSDVQLNSAILQGGSISIDPATLSIKTLLTGIGVIDVGDQSVLLLSGTISSGITIAFSGDAGTLCVESGASLEGMVDINASSVLDFQDISFAGSSLQVSGSQLRVSDGLRSEAINLSSSSLAGLNLSLQADGSGGTEVVASANSSSVPCYLEGTRIKTPMGDRPVECLRIGDLVTSTRGARIIKWIGHRTYKAQFPGRSDVCPVLIRRGSIDGRRPKQDLYISPLHGLFIDGVLIPAACLINGKSINSISPTCPYTYFHIETEQHSIIYADGMTAETFIDEQSRRLFDNAAEFTKLYSGAPGAGPGPFIRLAGGIRVERVRQRVARRAGADSVLSRHEDTVGYLESVGNSKAIGWAYSPSNPLLPLPIEVVKDGQLLAFSVANIFRADVKAAGIGTGRCGFSIDIPHTHLSYGRISARIAGTDKYLTC